MKSLTDQLAADKNVSPNLVRLADRAKHSTAPKPRNTYDDVLSSDDEETERTQQIFAAIHLSNCLAGLRLCRMQAATTWAMNTLEDAISAVEEQLSDVKEWLAKIEDASANSKRPGAFYDDGE